MAQRVHSAEQTFDCQFALLQNCKRTNVSSLPLIRRMQNATMEF